MNYSKRFIWVCALLLTAVISGCGGGGGKSPILGSGNVAPYTPPAGAIVPGASPSSSCIANATIPTVTASNPVAGNPSVPTSTSGVAGNGAVITATFSMAMNAASINASSFTLAPAGGAVLVPASVTYNATTYVATLTTSSALQPGTLYTAAVNNTVTSAGGVQMSCNYAWTFTTVSPVASDPSAVNLGTASTYGIFGGSAGMTNTGTNTLIQGDIGTTATTTSSVTGFHDPAGDVYTETTANIGAVSGTIYTCTTSTTGPTSTAVNATYCSKATTARQDALTAYNALVALPPGANPGNNLAGLILAPGTYTAPGGFFGVSGGNLTLDAKGNANAVWVFQMASTLAIGTPTASESVLLVNGAQAKNVFWQVGAAATINPAGGGTVVGTIISQSGMAFSTVGNVTPVTLNGRALSLGASVTVVDTEINVPAP